MSGEREEVDLRHILRVLRQRAWLILLLVVVAAGAAYGLSVRQAKVYESSSEVRVSNPNANSVFSQSGQPAIDPKRLVDTESKIVQSNDIRLAVNERLGDDAVLITSMTVSNPTGTDLLEISVTSTSPEVAQRAADTFAQVYVSSRVDQRLADLNARATELRRQANELGNQIAALPAGDPGRAALQTTQSTFTNLATQNEAEAALLKGNLQVVDSAQLPRAPIAPAPVRNAALVGGLALLLGIGLVLLRDRLDDRIRSTADLADALPDVPLLGAPPLHDANHRRGPSSSPDAPRTLVPRDSVDAESYRTIRTNVRFSGIDQARQVLMVTSASPGEGKSTLTANLAVAMADDGLRVVVVAADLRRPTVAGTFGVPAGAPGLADVLIGHDLWSALKPFTTEAHHTLHVLPAGRTAPNPAELLGSPRMREVLDELRAAGVDHVLIDCPPVLPVSDPLALAQLVDGVLLVVLSGSTTHQQLREASDRLTQVGASAIGVVLNGVRPAHGRASYEYDRSHDRGPHLSPIAPPHASTSRSTT